jgi:hypothetical protein
MTLQIQVLARRLQVQMVHSHLPLMHQVLYFLDGNYKPTLQAIQITPPQILKYELTTHSNIRQQL